MHTLIHAFEAAGLGQAPFEIVKSELGAANCSFCGRGLTNLYTVRSSDGLESIVGSECVNKAGDDSLVSSVKAEKKKLDMLKDLAGLADMELWIKENYHHFTMDTAVGYTYRIRKYNGEWATGEQSVTWERFAGFSLRGQQISRADYKEKKKYLKAFKEALKYQQEKGKSA